VLLRHAEAETPHSAQGDFERPLTAHGRAQACAAAERLQQLGLVPDLLLSSPAERARLTAQIVARQLQCPQPIDYDAALYQASAPALLATLQSCAAPVQTLLLISHNPGLSELAQRLAGSVQAAEVEVIGGTEIARVGHDPSFMLGTAQLCRIELDIGPWSELQGYCTEQKQ
jgi:phosphohistidine phosphatase SixA